MRSIDAGTFVYRPDPGDVVALGLDVGALLQPGEGIDTTSLAVTLSNAALVLGLIVADTAPRAPAVADDARTIVFWLSVDPVAQDNPAFDGWGTEVEVTIRFSTSASPPQTFERSARLGVRNR